MARFEDLPNDLIHPIISYLGLRDLVPFALVTKHIYQVCFPKLSRAQTLHNEWSKITVSYKWDIELVDLLIKLLKEPEAVRYIRECDSKQGFLERPAPNNSLRERDMEWDRKGNLDRLRDDLVLSPLIKNNAHVLNQWMTHLDGIDETHFSHISAPPYALIWSFLPDLHTLEIPSRARFDIPLLLQSPIGQGLKRVDFGRFTGDVLGTSNDVIDILQLPSLKELRVTTIEMVNSPVMVSPESQLSNIMASNMCHLERLEIIATAIKPPNLQTILSKIQRDSTQGLKYFKHTHAQATMGFIDIIFDGPGIIDALLQYAAHSLLELDISVKEYPVPVISFNTMLHQLRRSRSNFAIDQRLQGFQKLQYLGIGAEMLVQSWCLQIAPTSRAVEDRSVIDGFDARVQQIKLADMLPWGLRVLRIMSRENHKASQGVVTKKLIELLDIWYFKVPLLETLELCYWPEDESERVALWQLCDRLRVDLVYDVNKKWYK